jgi:hypothetical protein
MHLSEGQLFISKMDFIFDSDQAPINSLPVYDLGTSFASVLLSNPSKQEIAILRRQVAAGLPDMFYGRLLF